jgi:silicon transporter
MPYYEPDHGQGAAPIRIKKMPAAPVDDSDYDETPSKEPPKEEIDLFTGIRMAVSLGLVIFSVVIVMALIFGRQTKISSEVHPAFAFVLLWGAILWLSMIEGGQASMVGLPPINRELYKKSHPITYQICSMAHEGDNLDRYLMGRQFMVLLMVFVTNQCGAPLADAEVLGLPGVMTKIFLVSGIAMFLMTANIAQLPPQVNASRCMLDYVNTHFMTFTLYVALAIEASGLLHCCYLFQMIICKLAGKDVISKEAPRTGVENLLFWGRVLISLTILGYAFAVTLAALFQGKTTMWETIPEAIAVILFFVFMSIVGMLEGMQIAFFAVAKLSAEERAEHPWAMRTCDLLFKGDGRNLPGFMVGRQMCVTMCFFIIARVTTINVAPGEETIFGVSNAVQGFFNTGLLGALITTTVGSIVWQLVASVFPVAFLSTPITYILLRICLFFEFTGICAASWFFGLIHKSIAGFKFDEYYVGTPEERAARQMQDNDEVVEAGHLYPGVPIMPASLGREQLSLEELTELQRQLQDHEEDVKHRIRELEVRRQKLIDAKIKELESLKSEMLQSNAKLQYDIDTELGSDREH